jgi:virulence factor Mce-like protein
MTRNPLTAGLAGMGAIAVVLAVALVVPKLTFQAQTNAYGADFTNASGLQAGDPVDVAGVPAGQVTAVTLSGGHVHVAFRLDRHQPLGAASSAAIKLATILGTRYLAVQPAGPGALEPGATIPERRTTAAYSLTDIGTQAGADTSQLNMSDLKQLINVMRQDMPGDPALIKGALTGVTSATGLLSQDNAQFDQLLRSTQSVTSGLISQQQDLVTLLGDGQLVLSTLTERRATIAALINDLDTLASQLSGFLADNKTALGSVLSQVNILTSRLREDERPLSATLTQLGPGTRGLVNATGNGPWGDVAGPAGPIPDNLLCLAGLLTGCK